MNSIFYQQLYNELSDNNIITSEVNDDNTVITDENNKRCLITDELLLDTSVSLSCGHSFNYDAIFNEIKQQKFKPARTEICRISRYDIKCPYCRKIQHGLIPYCNGFEKIYYVNHPYHKQVMMDKCKYVYRYGKRKGQTCNTPTNGLYCRACHRKVKKQKLRLATKKRIKEETIKCKQNKKSIENNVCEPILKCDSVLKNGPNKGCMCGRAVKQNYTKCGYHTPKK